MARKRVDLLLRAIFQFLTSLLNFSQVYGGTKDGYAYVYIPIR
jgi:hypothetical protein